MSGDLDWARDGARWPNREASVFVPAAGLSWHVQRMGSGPVLLLVHGTGSSTHSWRALAPILAADFTVVAPDLPGHGFTTQPPADRLSLPGMAADLAALLRHLDLRPALVAGHSAGAAILCRMVLDGQVAPRGVVSLNGALLPLGGVAGTIFSPLARLLATSSLAARLLASRLSTRESVERLLAETGSVIEPEGVDLYVRLVRSPRHVSSALGMMANWQLEPLRRDLAKLGVPLLLIAGERDHSIPPRDAFRILDIVPDGAVETRRSLGHLAHEERPADLAVSITRFARTVGALPPI